MPKCAIKKCTNNKLKVQKKEGVSYFRFPQNTKRRERWRLVVARDRADESFKPNAHSLICSNHFSEDDMYLTEKGLKRLKRTAVPCLQVENVSGTSTDAYDSSDARRVSSTVIILPKPARGQPADPLGLPRWRREHDFKLVSLYREQECLWRPTCPAFRNGVARRAAWERIVAGLRLPGLVAGDARRKVQYLRDVYAAELGRLERSLRSGAEDAYEPALLVFADMHAFLKDVVAVESEPRDSDEEPAIKVEFEPEYSEEDEPDTISVSAQGSWAEGVAKRPQREGASDAGRADDEFAVFAHHVGTQMRSLPIEYALQAQEEIQSVLTRYRLKNVREQR